MAGRRFWADPDRRRAASASVLVHCAVLLAIASWPTTEPNDRPPERYLVLDLGTPSIADVTIDAPGSDAPAAVGPDVTVASDAPGRPTPGVGSEVTGGDPAADVETAAEEPSPAPSRTLVPVPTVVEPTSDEADTAGGAAAARQVVRPIAVTTVPAIEGPDLDVRELPDALPVPSPSLRASTVPLAEPTVRVTVAPETQALPVPTPDVSVDARPVEVPTPTAVREPVALDPPVLSVTAGESRSLGVTPSAGVRAMRTLTVPSVRIAVEPQPIVADSPGSAPDAVASDAPVGGDAPSSTQSEAPNDEVEAAVDASGAASVVGDETDVNGDAGVVAVPPTRVRETRSRPLAVLLDNAPDVDGDADVETGYPQAGLVEARWIVEMPVEGGATRLMVGFDGNEPAVVGPIRSARDYFVELAGRLDAVLVHSGGSTPAMAALRTGAATSIDAGAPPSQGLFYRDANAAADSWYTLFSSGVDLRSSMRTLGVDAERIVSGFVTSDDATPADVRADRVDVAWSGVYDTAFRFVPSQGRYRWVRNGEDAVDRAGTAVLVDAVLIARTTVRRLPYYQQELLYVGLSGGDGVLAWRGRLVEGRWSIDAIAGDAPAIRFVDRAGVEWPLAASKTWTSFVSDDVDVRWSLRP